MAAVTEKEARALLSDCDSLGGLERWIVEQPWIAVPGGWHVGPQRGGWRFEIRQVPGGLQLRANASGGGQPMVWTVTG
jgi:hypothetical protein